MTTTTTTAPAPAVVPARIVDRATCWDQRRIVAVLAAAFVDDPVFAWIEPDPVARRAVLPDLFAGFVTAFARQDETHVARPDGLPVGAALWAPPGVEAVHPDDAEMFEDGLTDLSPGARARADACTEAFAAAHPAEPAWYLNLLAASPAHQGRGVGSALLRAVLDRADRDGEPAYLEATNRRNRALYERHGFRLLREIPLPAGPTVYAMWRSPVMPPRPPWPRRP